MRHRSLIEHDAHVRMLSNGCDIHSFKLWEILFLLVNYNIGVRDCMYMYVCLGMLYNVKTEAGTPSNKTKNITKEVAVQQHQHMMTIVYLAF